MPKLKTIIQRKLLNESIASDKKLNLSEVLIDAHKQANFNLEKPLSKKRFSALYFVILICLTLILSKLVYLQIAKGAYYYELAQHNAVRIEETDAPRGIIYDTNGMVLVQNKPYFFYKKQIIDEQQAMSMSEQGVKIQEKILRYYPKQEILSHILGYTDTSNNAVSGLELTYNAELTGENGKQMIEVEAGGHKAIKRFMQKARLGDSLILHLDYGLQEVLFNALPNDKKSAAVAINPQNGGVLAIVSKPGFNPNMFVRGMSDNEYDLLVHSKSQPMFNRAISGQYAPGSTIKPLVAIAGLEENIIDPYKTIYDPGYLRLQDKYNPNKVYIFPDWKPHGTVDMFKAISESCNVYFYKLGGDLGFTKLAKHLKEFGLESKLGIDLPNEAKGLVPTQGWLGDLYHFAIGQGNLTVTPLQVAMYTAAIANNGTLFQPQIVDKIKSNGKIIDIKPKIIRDKLASQHTIDIVKKAMLGFLNTGMGRSLKSLPIKVAGKTGTAQAGYKEDNSWFTSFYQDKLAITVLVEQGGSGYKAALPVAKKAYEWYYKKLENLNNKNADYQTGANQTQK